MLSLVQRMNRIIHQHHSHKVGMDHSQLAQESITKQPRVFPIVLQISQLPCFCLVLDASLLKSQDCTISVNFADSSAAVEKLETLLLIEMESSWPSKLLWSTKFCPLLSSSSSLPPLEFHSPEVLSKSFCLSSSTACSPPGGSWTSKNGPLPNKYKL